MKQFLSRKEIPISVIIITCNQADILRLQLLALENQLADPGHEIIVSDDGSGEEESAKNAALANRSALTTGYVRQRNLGFRASRARNNGIRLARGELLVFLDGDMVPAPDFLNEHLNAHTGEKMLVAGHRIRRNFQDIVPCPTASELFHKLTKSKPEDATLKKRQEGEEKRRLHYLRSPHPWRVCFSCNLSVPNRPEVFFDERYIGWGPDDWQMTHRLCVREGYRPLYRPDIAAYELETPGGGSNVFRRGRHEQIVRFLVNLFRFADQCKELPVTEVFWSLRKLGYNPETGLWSLKTADSKVGEKEKLEDLIERTRQWLAVQGLYPESEEGDSAHT